MNKPGIPFLLRVWFLATALFPYAIHLVSKRLHGRMNAAPERFAERLGHTTLTSDKPVIWFHGASLGEIAQIGPLVARLRNANQTRILVTTSTQAGADWVARELPDVTHQFAPVDTPSAVKGFLNAWRISIAIFIEGDFSPRMISELQKRNIPHVLLNARNSRTRQRLPKVFASLLSGFSLITCRSDRVARGILALGFPEENIKTLPDLRITTAKLPCSAEQLSSFRRKIGSRAVWLAASTHKEEGQAVLTANKATLAESSTTLLIPAPRHPKRSAPLAIAAKEQEFTFAQRSTGDELTPATQIYLADTLGELGLFFSLSPIAFVGGSFGDEGGHNPYEPASFGTAILSGSRVKNFADAYEALTTAGAARLLKDPSQLSGALIELMRSDQTAEMGQAGMAFMEASEDGVSVTVDIIQSMLTKRDAAL
ncbi:MAG: 3-deoxy-D-manno-octulosonic acid transferase [Arenibacterium sp.]